MQEAKQKPNGKPLLYTFLYSRHDFMLPPFSRETVAIYILPRFVHMKIYVTHIAFVHNTKITSSSGSEHTLLDVGVSYMTINNTCWGQSFHVPYQYRIARKFDGELNLAVLRSGLKPLN